MTHRFACRKRSAIGDVISLDNDVELEPYMSTYEPPPGRTLSGRKVRKTNSLNLVFNSRYRNPENRELLMGEQQPLGKAYAILAVMMHGPLLPTEIAQHDERRRIFIAAAPYAMSKDDIDSVLSHQDFDELRIYLHNLLTTSCRPITSLLFNDARNFFQTQVFGCPQHNAEYKMHLGLLGTESVFDQ